MFKERTLPYNYGEDLGPDHKYCTWSAALGNDDVTKLLGADSMEGMMEFRAVGRENANASLPDQNPAVSGYESFESTERKPPLFNACTHRVLRGSNYPVTVSYYGYLDKPYLNYYYRHISSWGMGSINALSSHFNVDVSNAQRSAWGMMQPRFEGDISMCNFIIELRDFRSLARFLLNKPLRKLSNLFRRLKSRKRLDPTKPAAQLHLANEFALKPLVSDVITISQQIDELITSVQQDFADAGRERNSRHYSECFPVSENNELSGYHQSRYPYYMAGASEQLTFTATMEYSYEYNMRSSLAAIAKYWGFTPDAEAVWNAIPFSFLVDYFLTVGRALKINSRDKNVLLQMHQYCESYLSERTSGLHYKASQLIGPMLGQGTVRSPGTAGNYLVHGSESTFYTRRMLTPNRWGVLPTLKRPSSKQGWNMLALARSFF